MRGTTLIFFCGTLALGASGLAADGETASGPSVGHPLSTLCDLICGGKWEQANKPYPDEIRTTLSYRWNGQAGEIVGRELTGGGVKFTHTDVTVRYRLAEDDTIEALRVKNETPDAHAVVTIGEQSFVEVSSPDANGYVTTSSYEFATPDEMLLTVEMTLPGEPPRKFSERFIR